MRIRRANAIKGEVDVPADKSISHRAALIASMADGESVIRNFAISRDCHSTLGCLRSMGLGIDVQEGVVRIKGVGKTGFIKPDGPLDCGNSGTTMRLVSGVLAGQGFESELVGDESLSGRPMNRIRKPLEQMGAKVASHSGRPPLSITGRTPLRSIDYELPVSSAQLKSCILLAGLNASGSTVVYSPPSPFRSPSSRDHTEVMLAYFGAACGQWYLEREGGFSHAVSVDGRSELSAREVAVPGDVSSAAFLMTAAALTPGSDLLLRNVGTNPTRTAFLEILISLGAQIKITAERTLCGEPRADVRISGGLENGSRRFGVSGSDAADVIDELPILAVAGTQIDGGFEVRDAEELRVKETDRISAVVTNLRKMGAAVEERPDGFSVERSDLKGAYLSSFGDHRIAMAFAIAGLIADGETRIGGADCVDVSFPGFFEVLDDVVE